MKKHSQKRRTGLTRETPFAFTCGICRRCCHGKIIQVNPYEIGRLAGNLGISTTDFIPTYTDNGGTHLKRGEDGACIFLGSAGCTVHRDRPLVCRLYPLGRHVQQDGAESFSETLPHAGCTGAYGENGTVAAYVHAQGAGPFMEAADRYVRLFWKLIEALHRHPERSVTEIPVGDTLLNTVKGENSGWMDMDVALSRYCAEAGMPVPDEPEAKAVMHIQAVETWLQTMTGGEDEEDA